MEEIPALFNGTEVFVDPISHVIKTVGLPVHCNDIAPPRYKVGASGIVATSSLENVMTQLCYLWTR
jgi:hypothetical protein